MYYDRLGRVHEVPAGFGTAREALVEALMAEGITDDMSLDARKPPSLADAWP